MAKARKGRKPCAHDKEFVYDRMKQYALDDFRNLSIDKLQSVATSIQVRNVKRYKKEELVPIVLKKHKELLTREQEIESIFDTIVSCGGAILFTEKEIDCIFVSTVTNEGLEFTDEMKNKFVHFTYNNDVWYQASSIAGFLQYRNTKQAIIKHVDGCNKMAYEMICADTRLHPETVFINEKGVLQLIHRSQKRLARGKKKGLEQVYVATTALYKQKQVYKIGKEECSIKRLRNMNSGRAPDDDMYLCYVVNCYSALKAERLIHDALDDYRLSPKREFFKLKSVIDDVMKSHNLAQ